MKKNLIIVLLLLIIGVIGYKFLSPKISLNKPKDKIVVCTSKKNRQTKKVTLYSTDGFITKADFEEIYEVKSFEEGDALIPTVLKKYDRMDLLYGDYLPKSEIRQNNLNQYNLNLTLTVDYSNFNAKNYVKENPSKKQYFDSEYNILLDEVVDGYKKIDVTCVEEKED